LSAGDEARSVSVDLWNTGNVAKGEHVMDREDRTEDMSEVETKRDRSGLPDDINSHRGSLAEEDPIGPQADVLSPTGTRIDDEMPESQQDLIREGTPRK
jgi:hypothetical protein